MKFAAPLYVFVCQVGFSKHLVIVSGFADKLNHTTKGSNKNHLGYVEKSEKHHAMVSSNERHGNTNTHFTAKSREAFAVPEFYRRLKEKVRSKTRKMLQTVKQYCQNNIANNSRLYDINKRYGGIIYFDIFHEFAYCQINKVCMCYRSSDMYDLKGCTYIAQLIFPPHNG